MLDDTIGVPAYFADLGQAEVHEIITEINDRPRKTLSWATPVNGKLQSKPAQKVA